MGLNATVMCNCLNGDLIIPEQFKDIFEVDIEGYPSLMVGYVGNEDIHREFDSWIVRCCPHEDMNMASERISNWPGVRVFQSVLRELNESNEYDTLLCEIPDLNGGLTAPIEAAKMLSELEVFHASDASGTKYVLANFADDEVIWEYIEQYEGDVVFSGSEGIRLGLDERGLFVKANNGSELFRSNRFRQDLDKSERHVSAEVRFTDLNNGRVFSCSTAISGKPIPWEDGSWENAEGHRRFEYPEQFYTGVRSWAANEFLYITEPLAAICEAAIRANDPIRWC